MISFRRSLIWSVPVLTASLVVVGVAITKQKPAFAQDSGGSIAGVEPGDVFSNSRDTEVLGFDRFDPDEYRADKRAYLDRVEGGRIFDTLEVKEGNPPLVRMGDRVAYLIPVGGGSQEIAVKTQAESPVTFMAFGGGFFDRNGRTSITVEANRRGRAEALVSFGPHVYGSAFVLAGSPVTSGRVMFDFQMEEPLEPLSEQELARLKESRSRDTEAVDTKPVLPELPEGIDLGL